MDSKTAEMFRATGAKNKAFSNKASWVVERTPGGTRKKSSARRKSPPVSSGGQPHYLTPTTTGTIHSIHARYSGKDISKQMRKFTGPGKDDTLLNSEDYKFLQRSHLSEQHLDEFMRDAENSKNMIGMVDTIFGQIDNYVKAHGLRLTEMFGMLDKDREGFLRACPKGHVSAPPPVFYRLSEISPLLSFTEMEVTTWVMFMERDHRKERSMGEGKARLKKDVRITFNEFNKAFKKYRRRRAPKSTPAKGAKAGARKTSPAASTAAKKSVKKKKSPLSAQRRAWNRQEALRQKRESAQAESYQKARVEAFKKNAQKNLKANLDAEKKKRQALARKLACMTLEAVEAETDAVINEEVPTSNLVKPLEETHWLDHEAQVEDEYKHLHHHIHRFGAHETTGGTGGGMYFGSLTDADAEQKLREEEDDAAHKRVGRHRYKSGEYYKMKYDISRRRLKSENEELKHTREAVKDCAREIENGKKELELKKTNLKNCEYKVKTLLWMLKEIVENWMDKNKGIDVPETAPVPPELLDGSAMVPRASDDENEEKNKMLGDFINSKMDCISRTIPLWSDAFKGDGTALPDEFSSDQAEEMMEKMQALLANWKGANTSGRNAMMQEVEDALEDGRQ